jgi:imidazolonepropionase-like amidohydrolase
MVFLSVRLSASPGSPTVASGPRLDSTVAATLLVFDGVTVIDVQHGQRLQAQRVVIAGNRIRAVGSVTTVHLPPGARVIDARGKYLIPGLWDMHIHVGGEGTVNQQDTVYPRSIAYGVTGLREMAQRFPYGTDSFRVWRREIMAGRRVGPRVIGPSVDNTYGVSMNTPAAAARVIDSLKAAGIIFLKLHDDNMSRALFFAIAREARRVGLPFVGHVPLTVTEVEVSDSGQRSVEHVVENHTCYPNFPRPLDSRALQRCAPVAAAYVRNETWWTPTLVAARHNWGGETIVPNLQQFVRMMHHFGVQMLAGTDWDVSYMREEPTFQPGKSLHEELRLLVGGGLTPLEALQTATLNPAKFLNATDSLGTIAPGKLADLVLLDADPLADIHNTTAIRAVVANGRYFGRATLDQLLATLTSRR